MEKFYKNFNFSIIMGNTIKMFLFSKKKESYLLFFHDNQMVFKWRPSGTFK